MRGIRQFVTTLRLDLDEADARARVHAALMHLGASPRGADGPWDLYAIGSRLWVRLWGVWGRFADAHLPLIVRVRFAVDDGESVVNVVIDSDERWYLVYTTSVTAAYERRFAEILQRLANVEQT